MGKNYQQFHSHSDSYSEIIKTTRKPFVIFLHGDRLFCETEEVQDFAFCPSTLLGMKFGCLID
ncbi:hypothetical protein T02_12240 [Trichinella nativa]|uniref:Uncharacterized protein n=1 Tax=Trichinella nativa TaxID=6335 RepID=A0A0V1LGF1_9BILA|nr:hypothetical protein T02_12240 [Trichinella nativa]